MAYTKKALRKPEIYGVCGPKNVGKDTFAQALVASVRSTPFVVIPLAKPLKEQVSRIFHLDEASLYDRELKEEPFPLPVEMDTYLPAMRVETGLDLIPRGLVAKSRRELMQFYGTDYVRAAQDDYWLQRWKVDVSQHRRVVAPDIRYLNEAQFLRDLGGKIVRVSRPGVSGEGHASETEGLQITADLHLHMVDGDTSLLDRAARLISLGKFPNTGVYHWPRVEEALAAYAGGAALTSAAAHLGETHKDPYTFKVLLEYYGRERRGRPANSRRVPHRAGSGGVEKYCSRCSEWQPLSAFNRSVRSWDGLHGLCRACAKGYNAARYEKYGKNVSLQWVWEKTQQGAAKRGIGYEITAEDLDALWAAQEGRCYYTNRQLLLRQGERDRVSVDRLDSEKPYRLDNVVLCTSTVNMMKRDMTVEEFLMVVQDIYNHKGRDGA